MIILILIGGDNMQKNDLVTIDSKRNTVLDGAFSEERVTRGKGVSMKSRIEKENHQTLEFSVEF